MLFFTPHFHSVGLTIEPKIAYDAEGVEWRISYKEYIYSGVGSYYKVLIKSADGKERYTGRLLHDLKKPKANLKRVTFKPEGQDSFELMASSPFPGIKASDFLKSTSASVLSKRHYVELDPDEPLIDLTNLD